MKPRRNISFLLTAFFLLAATTPASAFEYCRCTQEFTPVEAWENAAAVFSGTVTKVEDYATKNIRVYFKVDRTWKGPQSQELKVFTDRYDALGFIRFGITCGYPFEEGKQYLVYAVNDKLSPLLVDKCTRTRLISEAQEDLDTLGEPDVTFTENGPIRRHRPGQNTNGGTQ